ncbi:MAG: metallophosphoesterase [Acidobacteriia bacterium]|nr:metallophosphoesterase [Terriglobia bacterium]
MAITRRAVLKSLLAAGVGGIGGGGAYGYLYGRHALEVTRATVPVAGLPRALGGLTVGLLTDVHRSRWVSHDDVAHAVTALMSQRPDLIVLGGDYVSWQDKDFIEPSAEALAPLSAPNGVFAILGNHDDDHRTPAALEKRGVQVLKDARTRLTIRNETLELVGIRFWTKRQIEIAELTRDAIGTTVLLAHDPRRITEAAALNVPLVLSGHTHGGQVVLPVLGAIAAQKFPVAAGLARRDRTTMFVSRGVGTIYVPVRINCPPEVAVLTLTTA